MPPAVQTGKPPSMTPAAPNPLRNRAVATIEGTDPPNSPTTLAQAAADDGFLKAYILRRIRTPQDAEDYVQDVYARVLGSNLPSENVRDWRGILRRIASSVIVDRYRHSTVRRHAAHREIDEEAHAIADSVANTEAIVADRQTLNRVQGVLDGLDPICRACFMMARVEGDSHKAVADRLGIEPVAVGRNIEKALAALARRRLASHVD